jgi:hypothetical protein
MEPSARVILDSIHPDGVSRLTTMEVVMHRFVLTEFNTHRMFSRNSASSRAIPVSKQRAQVEDDPAFPLAWPTEQKGMQGGTPLTPSVQAQAIEVWREAAWQMSDAAQALANIGVHKSVTNRLLEPFLWHTMIVSATDWNNFFELRSNPLAQPEIRAVSDLMMEALWASEPTTLQYGDWHLPYVSGYDYDDIMSMNDTPFYTLDPPDTYDLLTIARMCSAARCARVSYLTHDTGTVDIGKDITLACRLMDPGDGPMHASPFEHVATPATQDDVVAGNFHGWKQWRHELESIRG